VVAPEAPTAYSFNHMILALRLPEELAEKTFFAAREHKPSGRLLFFDPTDELTPLGYLPAPLQASRGLLVREEGGELVELPLLPPATNRLLRTGKLVLTPAGTLAGQVQEIRWGQPGSALRRLLLSAPAAERSKRLESFLGVFLGGFALERTSMENLEAYHDPLVVNFRFTAPGYAKTAGELLLVRPRVLGAKGLGGLEEKKERRYPVEFDETTLQSDSFEILLPAGYEVEELPAPVAGANDFVEYRSQVEAEGNRLHYQRSYTIKQVRVPKERLGELKEFYRQVAADERNQVVLKKIPQAAPD